MVSGLSRRVHSAIGTLLLWLLFSSAVWLRADEQHPSTPPPADPLRLVLPPVIWSAVGIEANLYFDNVVLALNPTNYAFDITCAKGQQQVERWSFTPSPGDVGDHPLILEVFNERNELLSRGTTVVRVVASPTKRRALHLLAVGDSLTHASAYTGRLLELGKGDGAPAVQLVGSHGPQGMPGENRHEGYGGWTARRFATHYTPTARQGDYRQRGSPFLYEMPDGSRKLDFTQYCRDVNGGAFPEFVTIFLGPNDIFSNRDDTIEAGIDDMLAHYDQLIAMIRTASPMTRIGVLLPVPPAATQDAFGANYASGQTRWQYLRNQHRLVERMLERYAQRENELIDLVPTHLNLDCARNYPQASVAPNAHAESPVVRLNNGVHPSAAGYRQIGDTVWCWLVGRS